MNNKDPDEEISEKIEKNIEETENAGNDAVKDEEVYEDFEDEESLRELVVPGEVLSEDVKNFIPGRGTILNKEKNCIVSLHIGLKQLSKNYINVIPLKGLYTPQPGDKIIGVIIDKNPVKYKLDINSNELGQLKPKNTVKKTKMRYAKGRGRNQSFSDDLTTERYKIGEVLIVKVLSADRLNIPELTTVGKYLGIKNGGIVVTIDPPKIPRIIGRNGSMIKLLKNLTNTNIFVTQNGRIWLKGEDLDHERLLIDAIQKIEREAHTVGLTDRMQEYIENEKIKRGIK
jgi:exosome complex component RRP4